MPQRMTHRSSRLVPPKIVRPAAIPPEIAPSGRSGFKLWFSTAHGSPALTGSARVCYGSSTIGSPGSLSLRQHLSLSDSLSLSITHSLCVSERKKEDRGGKKEERKRKRLRYAMFRPKKRKDKEAKKNKERRRKKGVSETLKRCEFTEGRMVC
jgi:hypothetical protein